MRFVHQREKPHGCEFIGCGKRYLDKTGLAEHMRYFHQGEEKPFECEITGCDKRFSRTNSLADHMRSVHDYPKLKCSTGQCAAEFVYKKHFLVHAKQHLG